MRDAVITFAEEMESKLVQNDYKGGWAPQTCSIDFLEKKLLEEVLEYVKDRKKEELPDIANMAMMLWQRQNKSGLFK